METYTRVSDNAKRAVSIARVSTDDQVDKGFSLAAQLAANRKYAEAHGFDVVGEFVDEGVSGAIPFGERPAGARALALLRSGGAEVLLVQNVDRLSRDIVDLLVTIRSLLQAGIEVHTGDLGRVTSEYDIMLVIRGWQGSDELGKIRARSIRGKREKLAQGMIVGGHLPYGYAHLRDEKGRAVNFEINPAPAEVVRLIFQWYTQGDGKGAPLSLYEIAARLREAGIPTQMGGRWAQAIVRRILRNHVYRGEWCYTARATDELPEETFTIAVPAIVDPATWNAAQVQLERNKLKAKRNAKRDYLLRGIIKCGCGYGMTGAVDKHYPYYTCNSVPMFKQDRQCKEKSIRADLVDAAAWLALRDRLEHSETLEADLREAQRREEAAQEPQRAELETVRAMMREAEKDAATLADSLNALGKRKGLVAQTLQDRIDAVDARYTDLARRRDELETALAKRLYTDEAIRRDLDFAADRRAGLADADHATKRAMLDQFNARVIVTDGNATLYYTMPDEVSIDLQLYPPHFSRLQ